MKRESITTTYFCRVTVSQRIKETDRSKYWMTHSLDPLVAVDGEKETFSYSMTAMAGDRRARKVERR